MSSPRPILVSAGIFVRRGRLLLARRPAGGAHAGLWEFPGGKVEPDETPEAALAREWREELGVSIAGLTPFAFTTEERPDANEARLLAMPPADLPALERLLAEGLGSFLDTISADERLCREALLADPYIEGSESLDGSGLKFAKRVGGRLVEGLLVPTPAGVRAYENLCPHVPVPLDRIEGGFLSLGHLVCKNHGALFAPESGVCVSGPCRGESLRPVALVPVEDGWAVSS